MRGATAAAALGVALAWPGTATAATPPAGWTPGAVEATAFAQGRQGPVSFALRTPGGRVTCHHCDRRVRTASVVKAMLLVAHLRRGRVARRPLDDGQRRLLSDMVRRSDDIAAQRVLGAVGVDGLRRVARRAGMTRTVPRAPFWGATTTTARDQTRFMLVVDALLPPRHRAFGMRLLATVVPAQRWGVGRVRPPCWELYFKGGWGSGVGLVEHQVALLRRGDERLSLAIMTTDNPGKRYGERSLQGVAQRLLRGLGC